MTFEYNILLLVLCINLLLLNIIYIVFASANTSNTASCESIGIFLHFFLISTFFLISSMSVFRYLLPKSLFIKLLRHFNLISISISYGLTSVIVIISILTPPGLSKYVNTSNQMYSVFRYFIKNLFVY